MPLDGWSQLEAVIVSTLHVRWWMHPFTIFLKKICGAYDLYIADTFHPRSSTIARDQKLGRIQFN